MKEKKNKIENEQTDNTQNEDSQVKTEVNEIEKLKADLEHWKNEYYRAYADMQNLRKSVEKEHKEALKYRVEGFVADLIPILDSFHYALQNDAKNEEMKNFLVGFQYIYRNLVSVLENEVVTEYSPKVGDSFDPLFMQAIEKRESEQKDNTVLEVKVKGYKLHEHLIRPAIVVVSGKENKQENVTPKKDA